MHRPLQPYTPTLHPSTLTSTLPRPGLARRVVAPGNGSLALRGPAQLGLVLQRGFRVFLLSSKRSLNDKPKNRILLCVCVYVCLFIYTHVCVCENIHRTCKYLCIYVCNVFAFACFQWYTQPKGLHKLLAVCTRLGLSLPGAEICPTPP